MGEIMTSFRTLARSLLALAVGIVSGCSSDSPSAPATPASLDVSRLMSEIGVAAIASPLGGAAVTAAASAPSCAYDATSKSFLCAPVTANGLTITRQYTLVDAAGRSLSTSDAKVVAAIRTRTSVVGTLTGP